MDEFLKALGVSFAVYGTLLILAGGAIFFLSKFFE